MCVKKSGISQYYRQYPMKLAREVLLPNTCLKTECAATSDERVLPKAKGVTLVSRQDQYSVSLAFANKTVVF